MSYRKITQKRFFCKCEKCGWKWRSDKLPNACAKCKTTAWNKNSNSKMRQIEM